jgi:hypothetical protein
VSGPRHNVHVRVNDPDTGRPIPVRIRFTDSAGRYYPPYGRLTQFEPSTAAANAGNVAMNGEYFAYMDGQCEIFLPGEPLRVHIERGAEYQSLTEEVRLGPGKLALRFDLPRCARLDEQRWFSGDPRIFDVSPHAAHLEASAEGVHAANLLARATSQITQSSDLLPSLAATTDWAVTNLLAWSGREACLDRNGHLLAVNSYHSHPTLGCLCLLHCHRPIFPLRFGPPDTLDDWTLEDWCRQCHRKEGLVVWHWQAGSAGGEAIADLVNGHLDALDLDDWTAPQGLIPWYRLLNAGFRLPLACGSGKCDSSRPAGAVRTYARLAEGQRFSYGAWIEAVRAGRTFVTEGSLLLFTVNDADPGAEFEDIARPCRIRAEVLGRHPIDRIEVLADGQVIAEGRSPLEIESGAAGWWAARCLSGGRITAHSSPVYSFLGSPLAARKEAVAYLSGHFRRMLEWARETGRFAAPAQRDHLAQIFQTAQNMLDSVARS